MAANNYETFTGPVPASQLPAFLRTKLCPLLPYSLPLYRRCQFYLERELTVVSPPSTGERAPASPEVWVAVSTRSRGSASERTYRGNGNEDRLADWLQSLQTPPLRTSNSGTEQEEKKEIWLAAYLDLREPGQTQVWFFGSWEATWSPQLTPTSTSSTTESSSQPSAPLTKPTPTRVHIALAQRLFHRLRTHQIPTLPLEPTAQYQTMKAAGKIMSDPYRRSKVLFGTLAEASAWIVSDDVVSSERSHYTDKDPINSREKKNSFVTRSDTSYLKYILTLPPSPSQQQTSSTSFYTGPLETRHLQTVLDRTKIPRTLETLRSLVSVGLFPSQPDNDETSTSSADPDPVAWGILSKDASIASLHTEDGYRGRGLAERVVRELMRLQAGTFKSEIDESKEKEEVAWAHTDVSVTNLPSRRVFEKMDARVGWGVSWIEVEVGEE